MFYFLFKLNFPDYFGEIIIVMEFHKLSRAEIIKHTCNWVIFGAFDALFDPSVHGSFLEILKSLAWFVIPCMLVYYSLALVTYPNYAFGNIYLLCLFLAATYLFFAWTEYLNTGYRIRSGEKTLGLMFLDASLIVGLIGIAAFSSFTNRQARIVIEEQDRKEREVIVQELSSIETHFNSELTSRFLKFILTEVEPQSGAAANAVKLYSSIIKYTFATKSDELVPLILELDFIESYLDIQRKIHEETYVNLSCKGDIQAHKIYPRLLVSLIENAFKHGITDDPNNPVTIVLETHDEHICFKVDNKKDKVKLKVISGLGQKNVRGALNIFYADKYQLKIEESPDFYSAQMILFQNDKEGRINQKHILDKTSI